MTIQLALGIMNPLVMILVAIIIGAEKFLPQPEITAGLVGIIAFFAGITMIIQSDLFENFAFSLM